MPDPDASDTAHHAFIPSDGDSCICAECGEHGNWHKERTMPDQEELTSQCPMCGRACSGADYHAVVSEMRDTQADHEQQIRELEAELRAMERAF